MSLDIDKVHKSARAVAKFLQKNPKEPGSEAIHRLRTNVRSLETAFAMLGMAKKSPVKRLVRDLGTVRKRAGKVRDMDVLTEDASKLKHDEERACLVRLLGYLAAERTRQARKLRREIDRETPSLRRRLKRSSRKIEKTVQDSHKKTNAAAAVPRTVQLSLELLNPRRLTRSNLHAYRLKVKDLRDILQLSNPKAELLKPLGEVKDAIGEWHDWEKLITIAEKQLRHEAPCSLLKRFKNASDAKFKRALALTTEFRSVLSATAEDRTSPAAAQSA